MKHLALLLTSLVAVLVFTSCACGSKFSLCGKKMSDINIAALNRSSCADCNRKQTFPSQGCEHQRYEEVQVTEYIEEEITVEGKSAKGGKNGLTETITIRRPVTKTVRQLVPCGDCGSKFCPEPDCCGITPVSVLSRATVQGGTGEPHVGTITTMKVLIDGARSNSDLN